MRLLSATFNPTPWNFVRWSQANFSSQMPLTLLARVDAGSWLHDLRRGHVAIHRGDRRCADLRDLSVAPIWLLYDWGVLTLRNASLNLWLAISCAVDVLGIGLSWSILRQRLSGQATVDEVEG